MAKLKGASPFKVISYHILPNAWAPIATVIAFNLAYLVVGVVVVEVVFVYRDRSTDGGFSDLKRYPGGSGVRFDFCGTYITLNLIADIIGIISNPRLLHPR